MQNRLTYTTVTYLLILGPLGSSRISRKHNTDTFSLYKLVLVEKCETVNCSNIQQTWSRISICLKLCFWSPDKCKFIIHMLYVHHLFHNSVSLAVNLWECQDRSFNFRVFVQFRVNFWFKAFSAEWIRHFFVSCSCLLCVKPFTGIISSPKYNMIFNWQLGQMSLSN